ncbi:signal transduction histidine kinase [Actinokineospora auranticolor]|uniref:histidine kinase n=1 Tax=Actinokineospora auranticolor TaxID=155976 RepID=A0A2S6H141_9PSEU|nr:signal transduction histidine kinase [Actinokineospora auranticolor]
MWIRITIAVVLAAAGFALIIEGLSAPTVPIGVGLVVCGVLPALALMSATARTGQVLTVVGASGTFTTVCLFVSARPDNTFGTIEAAALYWLLARVIVQCAPLRAAGFAFGLATVIATLPLRLDPAETHHKGVLIGILCVGIWFIGLLGLYLRLHDRRRADAYELARQAQRLAYARDLHDFVAHHVTAIVAQTKAVRYVTAAGVPPDPEDLDAMLAGIEQAGSRALASMRTMVTVMRGKAPEHPVTTLTEVVAAAVAGFAGPTPTTALDPGVADLMLPHPTVNAAQHVVLESLTNVLRHAPTATRVEIVARPGPESRFELSVTNDGGQPDEPRPQDGHGLVGLTERVTAVGGSLTAGATTDGWRVRAVLPAMVSAP